MMAVCRILGSVAALVFTVLLLAGEASAQSYPSRQVRLIVPFGAGGPTDVIARVVAQRLSEAWGQQVITENIPGAGGNTGVAMVAKAPADGYTILVVSTGFMVNPSMYSKIPYDPVKDFAPVTLVAASPNIISAHPALPAKTLKELIELVKANPGKYSFAQPSTGSTPHLAGELFKQEYKLDLVTVPFNSAALAINSTIGGHTPLAFTALPPAMSNIKEGKLHGLAVLSTKRSPALPEVPTNAEAGVGRARERYAHRHRGARRHAEGDHRSLAQRHREDGRDARGQAAAGDARLCAGREYARRVRSTHQGRDRALGQGGA